MNEIYNISDLNSSNIIVSVIPSKNRDQDFGFDPKSLNLEW